jgi:hypothetical protein
MKSKKDATPKLSKWIYKKMSKIIKNDTAV